MKQNGTVKFYNFAKGFSLSPMKQELISLYMPLWFDEIRENDVVTLK
jgi:hypothetical protein